MDDKATQRRQVYRDLRASPQWPIILADLENFTRQTTLIQKDGSVQANAAIWKCAQLELIRYMTLMGAEEQK